MEGFVKLHRKLRESAVWNDEKALKVFIWCLLKATHTPRDIMVGNRSVHLEPGQFVTGRKRAAEEVQMPEGTVYDVITSLKRQQQISVKANNKFSLITVVNWALYQFGDAESNNKNSVSPTTNQQQTNTDKNVKNIDPLNLPVAPFDPAEMERPYPENREDAMEEYQRRLMLYEDARWFSKYRGHPPEMPSQIVGR